MEVIFSVTITRKIKTKYKENVCLEDHYVYNVSKEYIEEKIEELKRLPDTEYVYISSYVTYDEQSKIDLDALKEILK